MWPGLTEKVQKWRGLCKRWAVEFLLLVEEVGRSWRVCGTGGPGALLTPWW